MHLHTFQKSKIISKRVHTFSMQTLWVSYYVHIYVDMYMMPSLMHKLWRNYTIVEG